MILETLDADQPLSTGRMDWDIGPVSATGTPGDSGPVQVALSNLCLLVIGAGQTAEAMAARFFRNGPQRLIVANRTLSKGQSFANRYGGEAVSLDALSEGLNHADVVVSCTASDQPLLTKSQVEAAVKGRFHKPLFVADIALRGDVDAQVGGVEEVFLTTAAEVCGAVAPEQQADAVMAWHERCLRAWQKRKMVEPLNQLRQTAESVRDAALQKAARLLKAGKSPDEALTFLANAITNKFLHPPTAKMRVAWLSGDRDLLHAANRLFAALES